VIDQVADIQGKHWGQKGNQGYSPRLKVPENIEIERKPSGGRHQTQEKNRIDRAVGNVLWPGAVRERIDRQIKRNRDEEAAGDLNQSAEVPVNGFDGDRTQGLKKRSAQDRSDAEAGRCRKMQRGMKHQPEPGDTQEIRQKTLR